MRKVILGLPLILLACGNPQQAVNNDVDAAVIALTVAETVALKYTSLPRCPAAAICSDEATVERIKAADRAAYAAVKTAQADRTLVGAALAAIANLKSVTPPMK